MTKSTKELLEALGRDLDASKGKLIPAEYWEREQKAVDEMHAQNEALYKSLRMTHEKFHQPFDL